MGGFVTRAWAEHVAKQASAAPAEPRRDCGHPGCRYASEPNRGMRVGKPGCVCDLCICGADMHASAADKPSGKHWPWCKTPTRETRE